MMTAKQKGFIDSLMKEVNETGIDVLTIDGVRDHLEAGEHGTSKQEASEVIEALLEAKKNAPAAPKEEKVSTTHIQTAIDKLLKGKRKNKQITLIKLGKATGKGNITKLTTFTDDELLKAEPILKEEKIIK
ncbi:hypothetical protein [Salicibibacter kimchii]|uniref:Uncharacterized protein n=1 Tax=Salicibibacter kimchii TaxID=2099786 RepID=A0A345BUK7_9BACI|nr:hypothetical protein [Salicibibacter kimchii]AXF54638.1 hypothetical protein DT065_00485 [Salicibibacter kimchii]